MFLKKKTLSHKIALGIFLSGIIFSLSIHVVRSTEQQDEPELDQLFQAKKPEHVRGIHISSWIAGSPKARSRIWRLFRETELNCAVIDVKEYEGEVFIPGVAMAEKHNVFMNAVPDLREYVADLKKEGVYTIARLVVFKDNLMSRKRLDLAVKRPDGSLWTDHAGNSWLDPYHREVWEYAFSVASQCVSLGFQEIQFDYIRYPSDGDTRQCRYSFAHHNSSSAARNLDQFLEEASRRLKPRGVNLSIDIFGLIPSVEHDMGIGQSFLRMTRHVDFVSPMVYPSHYAKGEYGIPDPNLEPYKVVHRTMSDAKKRLGDEFVRLRPYLQDFSMGAFYGKEQVRAQIKACEDLGIKDWLLWNPNSQFTRAALRAKKEM